jgi:hypothetical protein
MDSKKIEKPAVDEPLPYGATFIGSGSTIARAAEQMIAAVQTAANVADILECHEYPAVFRVDFTVHPIVPNGNPIVILQPRSRDVLPLPRLVELMPQDPKVHNSYCSVRQIGADHCEGAIRARIFKFDPELFYELQQAYDGSAPAVINKIWKRATPYFSKDPV